jgi:GTP-binding protein EngB required for normal cell division
VICKILGTFPQRRDTTTETRGKSPSLDAGVEAMERTIILLGKVGHGKTHLFNKLCGRSQRSTMIAGTCTLEIVDGHSLVWKMRVIDTPGFLGTSNVADTHIQAHRQVIESNNLTGLYIVVKCGAPGDMADCLNHLMNFVGSDDVRVIVTHMDVVYPHQTPSEVESMILSLSNLVGVSRSRIMGVRKDTDASTIEHFIFRNCHLPRQIRIEEEQLHYATYLTVGARRFNMDIGIAKEKLEAASQIVRLLTAHFGSDLMLAVKTRAIRDEMARFVEGMIQDVKWKAEGMPPEVQSAMRAKIADSIQPLFADLRSINCTHTRQPSRDALTSSGTYGKHISLNHGSSNERHKNSRNLACTGLFSPSRDGDEYPKSGEMTSSTNSCLLPSSKDRITDKGGSAAKPSSCNVRRQSAFYSDRIAGESLSAALSADAKKSEPPVAAYGSSVINRNEGRSPPYSHVGPAKIKVGDRTTVSGASPTTFNSDENLKRIAKPTDRGEVKVISATQGHIACESGRQEPVCRSLLSSDASVATAPKRTRDCFARPYPSTLVSDTCEHRESGHAASKGPRSLDLTRAQPLLDVELSPVAEERRRLGHFDDSFPSSNGVPSSANARECIREQSFVGDRFHRRAERDFQSSSLDTDTFLRDLNSSSRTAIDHAEIGRDAFDVNANHVSDFSRHTSENAPGAATDTSARRLGVAAPTDYGAARRSNRLTSDSSRHDAKDATSGVLDADLSNSTPSSSGVLNLPLSSSARLGMVTTLAERATGDMTSP